MFVACDNSSAVGLGEFWQNSFNIRNTLRALPAPPSESPWDLWSVPGLRWERLASFFATPSRKVFGREDRRVSVRVVSVNGQPLPLPQRQIEQTRGVEPQYV